MLFREGIDLWVLGSDAPECWIAAMVPTRTPLGRRPARAFHEILSGPSGQGVHPLSEIAARYNSPPGMSSSSFPTPPPSTGPSRGDPPPTAPPLPALAQTAADHGPISM